MEALAKIGLITDQINSAANVQTQTMIMHSPKNHAVLARSDNNGITNNCRTGEYTLEALTQKSTGADDK